MKQKYEILIPEEGRLAIRELAELDKNSMSLLCEETYDLKSVQEAAALGRDFLIHALRTRNLYPPRSYMEKIADAVMPFLAAPSSEPIEVLFDDSTSLSKEILVDELLDLETEEVEVIDDLLEDDYEDASDEGDEIKIDTSIKIADEDVVDGEDEL
ncbi:hypothetical protein [Desulfatirhabdium butyrativorans]|uniref:hypothetical protein n=1 Tax=Desulfatirhabdium butyrativorans TaxID=340467 RepID=UPI00040420CD|nr:hypothetical protein [Desulfatirhabdium butyrativorans]